MTTALAERPTDTPTVTQEQLTLIKQTVAQGATDAELKLFLFDCARQGVHPLDKLIHFTVRKDNYGNRKYTPITSIDFMRIRAADSGEMAGSDDPRFEGPSNGPFPDAATVTVYRMTQGQRFAYAATARWSEYKPDQNDFMWKKMPHTMLGKCAEALALRKGFPRQLAGLYAKEEMDQAEAPVATVAAREGMVLPHPTVSQPARVAPNESGDSGQSPAVEDDELPAGFHRIDDYRPDGNWHHVYWGRDAQGGTLIYKTKLVKIANAARVAFNDQVPVKLHSKKFPYLDDVEVLDGWPTQAELAATKFVPEPLSPVPAPAPLTDRDIPF